MKKRLLRLSIAGVIVLLSALFLARFVPSRPASSFDAAKFASALRAFARDRPAGGQQPPASVSLEELVVGGYLQAEDVRPFKGLAVTLSFAADASHPQSVLVRVKLADGTEMVGLADGSAQQTVPAWLVPTNSAPPPTRPGAD